MKSRTFLKSIGLISLAAVSLACTAGIANDSSPHHGSESLNTMDQLQNQNTPESVTVTVSQVLAREEIQPPVGVPLQPNRDIGFASVFLSFLNHQERDQIITLEAIEIYNVTSNQLEPFEFSGQEVILKPLENSIINIDLTNKVGYGSGQSAKAVVTYSIEGKTYKLESLMVSIDRN